MIILAKKLSQDLIAILIGRFNYFHIIYAFYQLKLYFFLILANLKYILMQTGGNSKKG